MHSEGCAGTTEYYRNAREALLVQKSNTGAIGRLCWYYRSTRDAVLLKQCTIGALGKLYWYRRVL